MSRPPGKVPDPLQFTEPQFNTWIELTYNQDQRDVLVYAHAIVKRTPHCPRGSLRVELVAMTRGIVMTSSEAGAFRPPASSLE